MTTVCTTVDSLEVVVTWIANDLLLLGFIPALFFTVDYVFLRPLRHYVPWWRSSVGVMFASLGLAVSIIGGIVLASLFLGDYPFRAWLRLIAYGGFSVSMFLLAIVYFAERTSARPVLFRKKEKNHHERHQHAGTESGND